MGDGNGTNKILNDQANYSLSQIKPNSIYFGHPVNIYNTKKEVELINIISNAFPKYNIYNPNQKHNQKNYQLWKKETGSGMKYYYDVVLPKMEAGIFMTFEDGMWGAGVFGEAELLYNNGKSIWEIDNNGIIMYLPKLNLEKKLSIEETRERVYK